MYINDYLKIKNVPVSTTQGSQKKIESESFESILSESIKSTKNVEFSKHAMNRISERNLDLYENDTLARLNEAVSTAKEKGSKETLVLIDNNAFIVSVENNKVITTMCQNELKGNVFTNIDSTVIM